LADNARPRDEYLRAFETPNLHRVRHIGAASQLIGGSYSLDAGQYS
jgi:hypothetical protein